MIHLQASIKASKALQARILTLSTPEPNRYTPSTLQTAAVINICTYIYKSENFFTTQQNNVNKVPTTYTAIPKLHVRACTVHQKVTITL